MSIFVAFELFATGGEKAVKARHTKNQEYFCVNPQATARLACAGVYDEGDAEAPGSDHGGVHDDAQQAALHDFEKLGRFGAGLGIGVIGKQARKVEHAGHPGGEGEDVEGFKPEVEHGIEIRDWALGIGEIKV